MIKNTEIEDSDSDVIISSSVSPLPESGTKEIKWGHPRARIESDEELIDSLKDIVENIGRDRNDKKHRTVLLESRLALNLLGINWTEFAKQHLVFSLKSNNRLIVASIENLIQRICFELSVSIYYLSQSPNDLDMGSWLADTLSLNPNIKNGLSRSAFNNNLFYIRELDFPSKKFTRLEINMPYLFEGSDEKYRHANPSIIQCGDGYLATVRAVNYHQDKGTNFKCLDPGGVIMTKNFLLGLDSEYKIIWSTEIIDNSKTKRFNTQVRGLEDCRLFWIAPPIGCPTKALSITEAVTLFEDSNGKISSQVKYGVDFSRLGFTCVTADTRQSGTPQVSVCKLSKWLTEMGTASVDEVQPLIREERPGSCEKNWLPFFNPEGKFGLIYSYSPLIILNCPVVDEWKEKVINFLETDQSPSIQHSCQVIKEEKLDLDFSGEGFRGSGGPLSCKVDGRDCYLVATHGVIFNGGRFYNTRLSLFDLNWRLIGVSKAFYCRNKGVEYCAAISFNKTGTQLCLTMGVEDREAWVCSVLWEEVKKMILPANRYAIKYA
jgi:hypothetical protein